MVLFSECFNMNLTAFFLILCLSQGMSAPTPFFGDWKDRIVNIGNTVTQAAEDVGHNVKQGIQTVASHATTFFHNTFRSIKDGIQHVIHKIENLPNIIKQAGGSIVGKLIEILSVEADKALNALTRSVTDLTGTIEGEISKVKGNVGAAIRRATEDLLNQVQKLIEDQVGRHGQCGMSIKEDVGNFVRGLLEELLDCPLKLKAAGEQVAKQVKEIVEFVPQAVTNTINEFDTCLSNFVQDPKCLFKSFEYTMKQIEEAINKANDLRVAATSLILNGKRDLFMCALETTLNSCAKGADVVGKIRHCMQLN